jgi:hypothetical protein
MPTVRRAAWAAWAAWTCKEPQGFSRSDVHRRLVDRKPPAGSCRGFFFAELRGIWSWCRDVPARIRIRPAANTVGRTVSSYSCFERGRAPASNASQTPGRVRGTLRPSRHSAIYHRKGTFKCLRRILLCAWSTRQRICFLTRRAPCSVSMRDTSVRYRAVRASLSRTGSSSFAIKDFGTSAFIDSFNHQAPPSIASATMCGSDKPTTSTWAAQSAQSL